MNCLSKKSEFGAAWSGCYVGKLGVRRRLVQSLALFLHRFLVINLGRGYCASIMTDFLEGCAIYTFSDFDFDPALTFDSSADYFDV